MSTNATPSSRTTPWSAAGVPVPKISTAATNVLGIWSLSASSQWWPFCWLRKALDHGVVHDFGESACEPAASAIPIFSPPAAEENGVRFPSIRKRRRFSAVAGGLDLRLNQDTSKAISLKGDAPRIGGHRADLDQCPDSDNEQRNHQPAGEQRDQQLNHRCARMARIEVVNPQTAKK